MQIMGISSTNSTAQVLNPILFGKPATEAVSAAPPVAAKPPSAPATNPAPDPTARSSQTHGAPRASGGAAAAAAAQAMQISNYSMTVNGTQYDGSIVESGGQYTASVPNLPGATATGSSLAAAENNLNIRIDELV